MKIVNTLVAPLPETKECSKCKVNKPLSAFNKGKDTKIGYSSACKSCAYLHYRKNNPTDRQTISLEGEVWLPIKGFIGLYEVSNLGRVKSLKHIDRNGDIRKEYIFNKKDSYSKYHTIVLCKGEERKTVGVHVLVATAFIPNPENKPQPNHLNGIKYDNVVSNLEWATRSENSLHALKTGLVSRAGEKNGQSKLTESQVLNIYNSKDSTKEISKKYSISIANVRLIKTGQRWNHVTNNIAI